MGVSTRLTAIAVLAVMAGCEPMAPMGSHHPDWGVYQIHWGRAFPAALAANMKKFATKPRYVMFYRDLGRPYPRSSIEEIRKYKADPIISLEFWRWGRRTGSRGGSYLPDLNDGKYDAFFRQWAKDAREHGVRVLLRPGFEMNGDWFTWSGDPKLFIAVWRRMHGIFREEKAGNVEFVWAPNIQSAPDTPENDMHLYYPGDEYTDWVGLDGYNFGDDHDQWHKWESMQTVFAAALDEFDRRYPGQARDARGDGVGARAPSCASGFATRIAFLASRPRVEALVWFHYDKRSEGEPDWRLDSSPESLVAWNETFARPRPRGLAATTR